MSGGASVLTSIAGYGLRRLARTLDEGFGNKGDVNQSRHYKDPGQQSGLNLHSYFMGPILAQGVVTDSTALGHCYRVQLEKAHFPIICYCGGLGTYTSAGARDISTIQPGTKVMVVHHPQTYYGVIISTLPNDNIEGKLQLHTQLNHATRNRVDEAHLQPYKQGGRGFAASWTSGRHFDATTLGEKGFMSESGIRVFVDSFMAQLAVDESCGVFAFMHDQLLKIMGYNLRMATAGMEREGIDDQEEYNDWTGFTPYPWEQMGKYERVDPRREHPPEGWQISEPWYGVWEPKVDLQCPWHREREYHGYLGQGGKRTTNTKPKDPPEQAEFLQDDIQYPGMADDFTGLEGRRMISSAKAISIVKRIAVQAPVRRYVPEQTPNNEGDNPGNYKASSIIGGGPDHIIKGEIQTQGDPEELNRALGILDLHAYWFNYGCFHPFFYHELDWNVFSEEKLEHIEQACIKIPTYSELESSVFLKAPTPLEINIDHRYGAVKYWQTECGIDFLEDGGVTLYDGWGSELRMTAGQAWLSAPGDVWLNPGRNVNIWGADDVNIRAKNSVDIIASNKDVRIKAERNFHSLSGNSGIEGGTLIECRAPDQFDFEGKCGEDVISGGVFLRSEKGTIGGWGVNVYWRVGGGDIPAGVLCLDADQAKAPIVFWGNVEHHYLDTGCFWHLNTRDGAIAPAPTAALTDSGTIWPGNMCNEDGAVFGGAMAIGGAVASTEAFAAVECPFVGCLEGEALAKIEELIEDCRNFVNYDMPQVGQDFYFNILEEVFYTDDKPGDDTVIENAEFSLRTVEQYGTEDFRLYEMRWQQMGRKAGTLTNQWKENSVECRSDPETYPYPGKENFQGDKYYEQDTEIFDIKGTDGVSKNHGQQPDLAGIYKNPMYAQAKPTSLEQYKVIKQ